MVKRYTERGSTVAPHLSFGGHTDDEVRALLDDYAAAGIRRLVALRGDLPSGVGGASVSYSSTGGAGGSDGAANRQWRHASELVGFIRECTGDLFHIDVACYPEVHPEAGGYAEDVAWFKQKVEAGADSAITQYFYNPDAYFRFVDYCAGQGVSLPIVPGVMPISSYKNLVRFSDKCGAQIPRWLRRRLEDFADDPPSLRSFGIDVVTALCERLLEGGAPGLHFYTMNLSTASGKIWRNLDIEARRKRKQ